MIIREIQDEILKLKKEKDICILAHSYQSPDILEIADYTGDSYRLSVLASEIESKTIIMCGVLFMGETVKLLSPEKKVILPVEGATCPMAEQILPKRVADFKKANPKFKVVAYINTTAAIKAVCDVCVTSSSALKIVNAIEENDILFIPDKNLGAFVKEKLPHKNIVLWDGYCPVHNAITAEECEEAKKMHPNAKILMHPELPAEVLKYADLIGSTSDILNFAKDTNEECIIGTENHIADFLSQYNPDGKYFKLSKNLFCPDMRLTSLIDVYHAVKGDGGFEVTLDDELMILAKKPIDEMIRLGN